MPTTHSPTSAALSVEGISKSFGDRRVLTDISFSASQGDRIGLIGENGTGKSTLLSIIASETMATSAVCSPNRPADIGSSPTGNADNGTVSLTGTIGYLHQELPYPDETPINLVLDDAQRDARNALAEIEHAAAALANDPSASSLAQQYAEALELADLTHAWAADARRGEVMGGVGLAGVTGQDPVGSLSGGQRRRLSLAALLLEAPQTMLLDEPSNHLDDEALAYLEGVLKGWKGIIILASHDRTLLDAVTTRILDLDPIPEMARVLADARVEDDAKGPDSPTSNTLSAGDPRTDDPGSGFGGRMWNAGFSAARAERQAELVRWRERFAAESVEREALVHEIEVGSREVNRKNESKSESRITRKFYADKDARVTSRRARNARVRLETLERDRVRRPPEPLRFGGIVASDEKPAASEAPILSAKSLAVRARLAATTLTLKVGGRVLLTGSNGAGKSTLLATLAGEVEIEEGSLRVDSDVRVGYLPQEVTFARPERSAKVTYAHELGPEIAELRPLRDTGLLASRDLDRPVGQLSVGQRRRLALAGLLANPPAILLLDEPTNHLSLTLVEELEASLQDFTGALIVATHDRWFRSRWQHPVVHLG